MAILKWVKKGLVLTARLPFVPEKWRRLAGAADDAWDARKKDAKLPGEVLGLRDEP